MGTEEMQGSYDQLRLKNFFEKQDMLRKLGVTAPSQDPCKPATNTAQKTVDRRGRGRGKKHSRPLDSSSEDYENHDEDDDDHWNHRPKRKKWKSEGKAPLKSNTAWKNTSLAVKTAGRTENLGEGRYPKRVTARQIYEDTYVPSSDDLLYCADCKQEWEGECPIHGPLAVIEDTPIPADINDKTRANRTAPAIVTVANSKIPEAGNGVWARDFIPARIRFGPYGGKRVPPDVRNAYSWLVRKNGKPHVCVDASEPGLSNWMRYVNCARYDGEQNLEAFQYCGDIYYRTLRRIAPHEELLVWYGDDYGRILGIDPQICDAEDEEKWREMRFKCPGCEFSYISPLYLERHKKICRQLKTNGKTAGKTYQCEGCKFLYSDADYLRRHMRFCRKLQNRFYRTNETLETKEGTKISSDEPTVQSDKTEQNSNVDQRAPVNDSQSVTDSEFGRRPSSLLKENQKSEVELIAEETIGRSHHEPEISTAVPDRQTSNEPKASDVIHPEISSEIHLEISPDDERETCACTPSVTGSDESQSELETSSEASASDVSICPTIDRESELKRIELAYVRLERIPWFLDSRVSEKPFGCVDCNARFLERAARDSHVLHHGVETLFVCPISECHRAFCRKERLSEHVVIHAKEEEEVGNRTDVTSDEPSITEKYVESRTLRFFVCPRCYKFFSEREDLRSHLCTSPEKVSKTDQSKDTIDNPSEGKDYTCVECKQSFATSKHLMLHQVTHREGQRFASSLRGHHVLNERPDLQSCLVNGENIFFSEGIEQFSLQHTITTSLSMKLGDESISTESSLLLKLNSCQERDFAPSRIQEKSERRSPQLTLSGSLKNYIKTPKGMFSCSVCNLKFANESTLIVHRRIHRKTTPFICRLCKQVFLLSASFQRHILAHKAGDAGYDNSIETKTMLRAGRMCQKTNAL